MMNKKIVILLLVALTIITQSANCAIEKNNLFELEQDKLASIKKGYNLICDAASVAALGLAAKEVLADNDNNSLAPLLGLATGAVAAQVAQKLKLR